MLFCAFLTRKRITRRRQSIRIMDSRTITEILVMAFLILMSAYFSATETAFSSLNRTRLKTMAEKGSKRAARERRQRLRRIRLAFKEGRVITC